MSYSEEKIFSESAVKSFLKEVNKKVNEINNSNTIDGWGATFIGFAKTFGTPLSLILTAHSECAGKINSYLEDIQTSLIEYLEIFNDNDCDRIKLKVLFKYYDSPFTGDKDGYFPAKVTLTAVHSASGHGWQTA